MSIMMPIKVLHVDGPSVLCSAIGALKSLSSTLTNNLAMDAMLVPRGPKMKKSSR